MLRLNYSSLISSPTQPSASRRCNSSRCHFYPPRITSTCWRAQHYEKRTPHSIWAGVLLPLLPTALKGMQPACHRRFICTVFLSFPRRDERNERRKTLGKGVSPSLLAGSSNDDIPHNSRGNKALRHTQLHIVCMQMLMFALGILNYVTRLVVMVVVCRHTYNISFGFGRARRFPARAPDAAGHTHTYTHKRTRLHRNRRWLGYFGVIRCGINIVTVFKFAIIAVMLHCRT